MVYLGFLEDLVERFAENQGMVECAARGILGKPDSGGGVSLGVAVNEEGGLFRGGEAGG
jgi:hypothetical protein